MLLYFGVAWLRVGRDPAAGVVIPEFSPPDGIGPAAIRYIHQMRFDPECLAVGILDMAVKGYLSIEESAGEFTLRKRPGKAALTRGERIIADNLLITDSFTIARTGQKQLTGALDALRAWLKLEHEGRVFRSNRRWIGPGLLLSFTAPIVVSLRGPEPAGGMILALWLSLFGLGVAGMVHAALSAWKTARDVRGVPRYVSLAVAVFLSLFALPFLGAVLTGLLLFNEAGGTASVVLLLVLIPINAIFIHLMKAPTIAGRRLLDRIEGFKRYLTVAEADRVGAARTPERFERLLPYAIALGVSNVWTNQFNFELIVAGQPVDSLSHPRWYRGQSSPTVAAANFASALGPATVAGGDDGTGKAG